MPILYMHVIDRDPVMSLTSRDSPVPRVPRVLSIHYGDCGYWYDHSTCGSILVHCFGTTVPPCTDLDDSAL